MMNIIYSMVVSGFLCINLGRVRFCLNGVGRIK